MKLIIVAGLLMAAAYSGTCSADTLNHMGEPRPESQGGTAQVNADLGLALRGGEHGPWVALWRSVQLRVSQLRENQPLATRAAKEIRVYSGASPSVVMIVTDEGFGTGSVISDDGVILTNWHVVEGYSVVGVIFKPQPEGRSVGPADIILGIVEKVDEVADLAVVRIYTLPDSARPIPLGESATIQVGADVHAIGHPTGEAWTYTKGFVSQLRDSYEWTAELGLMHEANVIQTQTPISPGSSGGPLLNDSGAIIGINSFKTEGESLNFAVSVSEIRRFLVTDGDRIAAKASEDEPAVTCDIQSRASGRTENGDGDLYTIDLDCDDIDDGLIIVPDAESEPIVLVIDSNDDGRTDTIIIDKDRDYLWDVSYYDLNGDGEEDIVGIHSDGGLQPSRLETVEALQ